MPLICRAGCRTGRTSRTRSTPAACAPPPPGGPREETARPDAPRQKRPAWGGPGRRPCASARCPSRRRRRTDPGMPRPRRSFPSAPSPGPRPAGAACLTIASSTAGASSNAAEQATTGRLSISRAIHRLHAAASRLRASPSPEPGKQTTARCGSHAALGPEDACRLAIFRAKHDEWGAGLGIDSDRMQEFYVLGRLALIRAGIDRNSLPTIERRRHAQFRRANLLMGEGSTHAAR